MNNLAQSGYNAYVAKVNKEKRVLPFGKYLIYYNTTAVEINFYFALCGFPIALAFTVMSGEIY